MLLQLITPTETENFLSSVQQVVLENPLPLYRLHQISKLPEDKGGGEQPLRKNPFNYICFLRKPALLASVTLDFSICYSHTVVLLTGNLLVIAFIIINLKTCFHVI